MGHILREYLYCIAKSVNIDINNQLNMAVDQETDLPLITNNNNDLILRVSKTHIQIREPEDDGERSMYAQIKNQRAVSYVLYTHPPYDKRHPDMNAKLFFDASIEYFTLLGFTVDLIVGDWQFGDNLAEYRNNLSIGMTPKMAAENTWTGRRATANGFNNVTAYGDVTLSSERCIFTFSRK